MTSVPDLLRLHDAAVATEYKKLLCIHLQSGFFVVCVRLIVPKQDRDACLFSRTGLDHSELVDGRGTLS
jgi:hypothetical protein